LQECILQSAPKHVNGKLIVLFQRSPAIASLKLRCKFEVQQQSVLFGVWFKGSWGKQLSFQAKEVSIVFQEIHEGHIPKVSLQLHKQHRRSMVGETAMQNHSLQIKPVHRPRITLGPKRKYY
jgi:hypothetical protein